MNYFRVILFAIIPLLITTNGLSQGFHTGSNKAMKLYNEGVTSFDFMDYNKAEYYFREAIAVDDKFYEAYMMLGELLSKQKKYSEASSNFKIAVKLDSLFFKPVFFNMAMAEMLSGDYSNALVHFKVYIAQEGMSEKNKTIASRNIKNCEFALNAIKNPVPFSPISLGPGVNTKDDEYWPAITADGQMLMFTRQYRPDPGQSAFSQNQEDFFLSFMSDSSWQTAINAGGPLNTRQNEGAQTISSGGDYIFFTACDRPGGLGSCDLYFSSYSDGVWSQPSNLKFPVNTSSWESQPTISAEGRMLIFSSSRSGGFGGKDLWYSLLNSQNMFSVPVNMGNIINTDGDEMSPFLHFDGKTLYFSSDGRTGMGGFDIFMTKMNEDSTWTEPVNLGYPINTYNEESGLIIESTGEKAFFASVRDEMNGKDIFYFNLHESVRPNPVSYLKGKVYDRETGKMLKAAFELINLSTNKIAVKDSTDETGNFLVCLPSGNNYGINVYKPGYLFYSESFMFEGQHSAVKPYIKNINLNPIKVGERMLLANVFFEVDSWQLRKESLAELNNLAKLLNDNTDVSIEVGGYTDSTGSDEHNLLLSSKRAQSVVSYLVEKKIPPSRLKYKGYGNASPIGDNMTSEGRSLNRRTEVKVLVGNK